jgi:hypothetical protein
MGQTPHPSIDTRSTRSTSRVTIYQQALTGLCTLVPRVRLLALLAGPAPSGSADASRRCRGCFPPSPAPPDRTAPSFVRLLRQPDGEVVSPPLGHTELRGAPAGRCTRSGRPRRRHPPAATRPARTAPAAASSPSPSVPDATSRCPAPGRHAPTRSPRPDAESRPDTPRSTPTCPGRHRSTAPGTPPIPAPPPCPPARTAAAWILVAHHLLPRGLPDVHHRQALTTPSRDLAPRMLPRHHRDHRSPPLPGSGATAGTTFWWGSPDFSEGGLSGAGR